MSKNEFHSTDGNEAGPHGPSEPGGLLDFLRVAAVVVDNQGLITLWSPEAEGLFGYRAEEVFGEYAGRILVAPENHNVADQAFAQLLTGGSWAGVLPCRNKDGSLRHVEFRNFSLTDNENRLYTLGIATDRTKLHRLETDLALSMGLVKESPIGLAIFDKNLRYVLVNPALERINGVPAEKHLGRRLGEVLSWTDATHVETAMQEVLATGTPALDRSVVGRTPADPGVDHAWSVSHYRLQDINGRVIGLASSIVDVTERHRAAMEAARARQRLAVIAEASVRIGTTLDLDRTVRELAETAVTGLADLAGVDILDSVLNGQQPSRPRGKDSAIAFRNLALAAAYPTALVDAVNSMGEAPRHQENLLLTECVERGEPVHVPHVDEYVLSQLAQDPAAVLALARSGMHSYIAVPLIARGEALGALSLGRARNPLPFDKDDVMLACELAARAAVCIDNARWYRYERTTALALQRSLLPQQPPARDGLEIAYRYRPAGAASEIGGDWFDVLPLRDGKTALVVGDVMGSGVNAAAAMGRLRTATQTLTKLDLAPAEVLRHLDEIATNVESSFATCVFTVYDPVTGDCEISTAGHLPPVLVGPDGAATVVDMAPGVPLGVGGVEFGTHHLRLEPGSRLVLYTDGLVETREDPIDARVEVLRRLLDGCADPLEEVCDHLLDSLRHGDQYDDVALLIAAVGR